MPIGLRTACIMADLEAARAALTRGEDVNSKNDLGWTPLRWAVVNKKNSFVRLLLEQPELDLNLANNNSWTVLHCAVTSDYMEGVRPCFWPTLASIPIKRTIMAVHQQ